MSNHVSCFTLTYSMPSGEEAMILASSPLGRRLCLMPGVNPPCQIVFDGDFTRITSQPTVNSEHHCQTQHDPQHTQTHQYATQKPVASKQRNKPILISKNDIIQQIKTKYEEKRART